MLQASHPDHRDAMDDRRKRLGVNAGVDGKPESGGGENIREMREYVA